jgi:hypothetical protein
VWRRKNLCYSPRRVLFPALCKVMGWSSLSVAMTYIHPSDDLVLDAFSGMGGHNSGHINGRKEFSGVADTLELLKGNEIVVSADGLEPSTHALKGHCSAN